MSGWEALAIGNKDKIKETVIQQPPVIENTESTESKVVISSKDFMSKFPDISEEIKAQAFPPAITPSHVFCGMVGHEGTGKTGLAIDAHMHKYPDGMLMAMDFDNGALACKQAHYNGNTNIRILSPWVMQTEDRTAYNYISTYQRIMNICKYATEYALRQQEEGFEGPILNTFLVTAVDQFDSVCINNMKIYDLEMDATDAIEASAAKLNAEIGWNWNIRSTRFKQLTAQCQQLNRLGVDVYWETHLKEDKEGKVGFEGWKFAWEKNATNDLFQIIWCKAKPIRSSDGSLTGETRYFVDFFKEKTNSDLKGQERTYFITKKGEPAQWFGLPEVYLQR